MKNKKLEKWKKGAECQGLLAEFKNKIEFLEAQIEAVYNSDEVDFTNASIEDLKHKLTHNEFDIKDLWTSFINEILFKIERNEDTEKLIEYYEDRLKNSRLFLFLPINQYGQSNSILRYTELDIIRFKRSHYFGFEDTIDSLIGSDDIKTKDGGAF